MAIGDIYETPAIVKNRNITIGAGGTALDWNLESELDFNRNEWELIAVAIGVIAQQSYTPLIPFQTVRLDVSLSIRNYSNDGSHTDSLLKTGFLDWSLVDSSIEKRTVIGRDIEGTAQARTAIFVTANYKLPLVAVTPQNCNTSIEMAFSFQAKVANPSRNPFAKQPKEGGGALNWDLSFVILVGVLGIIGLVALGWAAEKTGVNVGVLGGVYTEGKKAVAAVIPKR